ncbi:MAG: hypothetical protein IJ716_04125 [Lachnospiraceae bacterium]|nr:hypothetical protein [Lachnospiraceae bacterium]
MQERKTPDLLTGGMGAPLRLVRTAKRMPSAPAGTERTPVQQRNTESRPQRKEAVEKRLIRLPALSVLNSA